MNAWESILKLLTNQRPRTGTYSIDVDNKRIPSMVPGNSQWLAPMLEAGIPVGLTPEQIQRAAQYNQATEGDWKPSDAPMSPFGSEYDLWNQSAPALWNARRQGYFSSLKDRMSK